MENIRPTFLGIGAQKAATSWLDFQLRKHSQVWLPPYKELHFFDRSLKYPSPNALATSSLLSRLTGGQAWESRRMRNGLRIILKTILSHQFDDAIWYSKYFFGYYDLDWYRSLFSQAKDYKVSGEITPAYSILKNEDVAQIKELNPDMKHIFIIRNPIDRAWSSIRYRKKIGSIDIDLNKSEEIISVLKSQHTVLRGDYERTLEVFLDCFDSNQILVCFYDAIQNDPVRLLSCITTFLDIANFKEFEIDNQRRINSMPQAPMPNDVRAYLIEAYEPLINKFSKTFGSYASIWNSEIKHSNLSAYNQLSNEELLPALHP